MKKSYCWGLRRKCAHEGMTKRQEKNEMFQNEIYENAAI